MTCNAPLNPKSMQPIDSKGPRGTLTEKSAQVHQAKRVSAENKGELVARMCPRSRNHQLAPLTTDDCITRNQKVKARSSAYKVKKGCIKVIARQKTLSGRSCRQGRRKVSRASGEVSGGGVLEFLGDAEARDL